MERMSATVEEILDGLDDAQRAAATAVDGPVRIIAGSAGSDGWEPGRWWRVTGPDGQLWCETSDEDEARARVRPGDTLERLWRCVEEEWRQEQP